MLKIDHLRHIDPELQGLSDEAVKAIRADLYALAELALDCWIKDVSHAALLEQKPKIQGRDKLSV